MLVGCSDGVHCHCRHGLLNRARADVICLENLRFSQKLAVHVVGASNTYKRSCLFSASQFHLEEYGNTAEFPDGRVEGTHKGNRPLLVSAASSL